MATAAAIVFAGTTVIALVGWWCATDRIVFLNAMLEAARTEIWTSGDPQ